MCPRIIFILSTICLSSVSGSMFDQFTGSIMPALRMVKDSLPIPSSIIEFAMSLAAETMLPIDSTNELCRNHSQMILQDFLNFNLWAFRMMDASTKLPSGLLDGNVKDVGNYAQCLEVMAPAGVFKGQHCVAKIQGNQSPLDHEVVTAKEFGLVFGFCIPSSCTFQDLQNHLNEVFDIANLSVALDETSCDTADDDPWDWVDWAGYLAVLLLVILVIASSAYDCWGDRDAEKKKLLTAFSLRVNVPHMLDTTRFLSAVCCLDGLRVFAILWVIVGHTFWNLVTSPQFRLKYIADRVDLFALAPMKNSPIALEVLLLLAGTLVVYNFFRYRNEGNNFNIFHYGFLQYFRLAPALAAVVLLYAGLAVHLNDGPYWKPVSHAARDTCRQNWLANVLFVNNFVNSDSSKECIGESWYLAVEFQLYLLSPLVLIPLYHKPRIGLQLTGVLYLATTLGALWNIFHYELKVCMPVRIDKRYEDRYNQEQIKTHLRAGSYILGMILGYLIYKIKQGHFYIKFSKAALWTGWVLSVSLMIADIYLINWFPIENYKYNPWLDTPYIVFSRQVFALSIFWVVLACTLGYGGWVDDFLSWGGWIPLSRLSYCAFISHLLVQSLKLYGMRNPLVLLGRIILFRSVADIICPFIAAALLYLTVQAPCKNIANWMLIGDKNNKAVEPRKEFNLTYPQMKP